MIKANVMVKNSILLMIFVLVVSCVPQQNSGTVVIGVMAPLSGDAASYGLSILKGAQLAVKEANLPNVKLVVEDSKCEAKEAVTVINKLISVDGVQAIIGEVCSGATLAAAPIAEQHNVVMISASSTSPEISKQKWVFRTVPSDALQGAFGARLVKERGFSRLAVLYPNEDYGVGFNAVLEEEFPKQQGKVVASEAFDRGTVDLRTQLTKIKAAKPDAIYLISNSPDSAVAALKQIKEMGINAAVFGSEGLKSDDILTGAGNAAEGMILTSVSGGTIGFITKHQAQYNSEPGPFAAQGYDAYKALALAIQQGARTGPEIREKLLQLQFTGASGAIDFDDNGDVSGNYDTLVVREGKFMPG